MSKIYLEIKDNMTEMEELNILYKLTKIFEKHPNNHLSHLFNGKLMDWVETCMKENTECDLLEKYNLIWNIYEQLIFNNHIIPKK